MASSGRKAKPIAVQESKRRVHISNAEKEARRAREAAIGGTTDHMAPPSYLATQKLKNRYSEIVSLLRAASERLCTDLDVDAVARYVLEEDEYIAASAALRKARRGKEDLKTIEAMQRLKNAAFKCVDASAKSIGLTVDARLRFDLREPEQDKPENRFARFQAANGR